MEWEEERLMTESWRNLEFSGHIKKDNLAKEKEKDLPENKRKSENERNILYILIAFAATEDMELLGEKWVNICKVLSTMPDI